MKLTTLLCATALGLAAPALAANPNYPAKPVRVIVGFPPGQATDDVTRRLMQELSTLMGKSFVVENRPGAGAGIAAEMVARAEPDGYTLLASSSGPLTINGWVYKNLRYDARKDFAPVAPMSSAALALVVKADAPWQTLEDLLAAAREQPGQLNFGTGGQGVTNHLAMEMLKDAAKVKLQHVPYKGGMAALNDLVGGQIEVMFEVASVAEPLIKQGQLRALAVSSADRVSVLPDVPTLVEQGYPVLAVPWAGIFAPAATPPEILEQLHKQITEITDSEAWREYSQSRGSTVLKMTRQEFADYMSRDIERWGDAVQKAGVQPQ